MEIIEEYYRLLGQLDTEVDRLNRWYGPLLSCKPGCSSCCMELTLLAVEAASVSLACLALDGEQRRIINRQAAAGDDGCPFLHLRLCLIYSSRPVICRTHGLPVAYVEPEMELIEVSACPVNFPPEHSFSQEGLLFLDGFNEQLLRINSRWEDDRTSRSPGRIAMRHLVHNLQGRGKQ